MRVQVFLLTILASGDSRLWLWSSPPGDTCWSTDWPEGMALLLWWPMVVEEVTSPGPWLYRTERKRHTGRELVSLVQTRSCCILRPRVASASFWENADVTPIPHLLFDSSGRGQSKQTHWPVCCCYLCSSAVAMNCAYAVTAAQLP